LRDVAVVKVARARSALEVELQDGTLLSARRILLATGVVDILPEIEGFKEFWGVSVFHCPYYHGWELRDQPLAVYGNDGSAVEKALLLTGWTSDLILYSDGPASLSPEDELKLSAVRIPIKEQKIRRLRGSDGLLDVIEFEDESLVPRSGVFLRPRLQYSTALTRELGCGLAETGAIRIDETCRTTVAGVYAAGEWTGTGGQVVTMAAEGTRAAYAINHDLVHEDLERGVLSSSAA
jgi:thioredoxin reductase